MNRGIKTPLGEEKEVLGGSAIYGSIAASTCAPVDIVGVAGEDFPARLRACAAKLRHVHLSEPGLEPVRAGGTLDLPAIRAALEEVGYPGAVSVEMRAAGLDAVRAAADFVGRVFS